MKLALKSLRLLQGAALLAAALIAKPALAAGSVPFHAAYDLQFSAQINPPLASVSAAGTGLATQLGRMTATSISEVVDLSTGEGLARYRYTGANGDAFEVEIDFTLTPTPTGFTSSGTWHVTSGTGRFAGASGGGALAGRIDFTGATVGVARITLDGVLTPPGI